VAHHAALRYAADDVRRYYDRHTRGFLAYGTGGGHGAIHRAVWGPGVTSRDQAFHYVDERLAAVIRRVVGESTDGTCQVVDLGCGVGASMCYLAERLPIRATGLTLSPVQARLATERIRSLGLDGRVTCLEASFEAIPAGVPAAEVAYAVESFAHATSPERFFAECARLVRPGGALILCDDFVGDATRRAARQYVGRFMRGWHLNTVLTPEAVMEMAEKAGFSSDSVEDLSASLEPFSMRDRMLDRVLGWLPLGATPLGPVVGGAALKRCLANGWTSYRLIVLRRRALAG
jgi:ubiquinone/menaquinone biosynthesis C-methylase UbiE